MCSNIPYVWGLSLSEFQKRIEHVRKLVLGKEHKIPLINKRFHFAPSQSILTFIYAKDGLVAWLEEAKKEFPKPIEDEIDYVPGTYPIYPDAREWFEKWFGKKGESV